LPQRSACVARLACWSAAAGVGQRAAAVRPAGRTVPGPAGQHRRRVLRSRSVGAQAPLHAAFVPAGPEQRPHSRAGGQRGGRLSECAPVAERSMYPDGYHVHNYPSGSRYEGGWKGGRKHGQGTYTYAGGGKYVGEFVDDKRHGQGAYTCEPCVRACVRARVRLRLRPRLRLPLPLPLRGER